MATECSVCVSYAHFYTATEFDLEAAFPLHVPSNVKHLPFGLSGLSY